MTWGTSHGHAERRCRDCAERFYPRYGFERYCFPCWRDRQDAEPRHCAHCETLRVERDELRAERNRARTDRDAMQAERDRAKSTFNSMAKEVFELRDKLAAQQPAPPDWPHMLPRLIQLAHPDKHANSHAANEATRWLLEQRAKLRR